MAMINELNLAPIGAAPSLRAELRRAYGDRFGMRERMLGYVTPQMYPDTAAEVISAMPEEYNGFSRAHLGFLLGAISMVAEGWESRIVWIQLGRDSSPVVHIGLAKANPFNVAQRNALHFLLRPHADEVSISPSAIGPTGYKFYSMRLWWD
jgi:hypothetical protein